MEAEEHPDEEEPGSKHDETQNEITKAETGLYLGFWKPKIRLRKLGISHLEYSKREDMSEKLKSDKKGKLLINKKKLYKRQIVFMKKWQIGKGFWRTMHSKKFFTVGGIKHQKLFTIFKIHV